MPGVVLQQLPIWVEYIKAFGPVILSLVGWIIVIIGWHFARKDNNNREDRRDIRSLIDSITGDIKNLESKAWTYYQQDAGDSVLLGVEIKRDFDALDARMKSLRNRSVGFQSIEALSKYHRILTGGEFEMATRTQVSPTDRRLLEVSAATTELISHIEDEYSRLYTSNSRSQDLAVRRNR